MIIMSLINFFDRRKDFSILDAFKILIILFVGISILSNFIPYYEGADSLVYGISSRNLATGSWGFSNELLEETGKWEFVPNQWVKTIQNTAVPIGGDGIYGFAAIF